MNNNLKRKLIIFLSPYYIRNKNKTTLVLNELLVDFEDVEVTQDNVNVFKRKFKLKYNERK